jgi:hypothetical protein
MHRLIRATLRSYRRAPVLWVSSALILALAVTGLATAYSLARGVLFRPLAFVRPERLVAVWPEHFVSQADLLFLRERSRGLGGIAAVAPGWGMALSGAGEPTRVMADRVSANLFEVLGRGRSSGAPSAPARTRSARRGSSWSVTTCGGAGLEAIKRSSEGRSGSTISRWRSSG